MPARLHDLFRAGTYRSKQFVIGVVTRYAVLLAAADVVALFPERVHFTAQIFFHNALDEQSAVL